MVTEREYESAQTSRHSLIHLCPLLPHFSFSIQGWTLHLVIYYLLIVKLKPIALPAAFLWLHWSWIKGATVRENMDGSVQTTLEKIIVHSLGQWRSPLYQNVCTWVKPSKKHCSSVSKVRGHFWIALTGKCC